MSEMTGKERISKILAGEPVDRIGLFEHFWGDTLQRWTAEGHIKEGESLEEHFGFDMQGSPWFDMKIKVGFEPITIEEDEETILQRDGNGALLRRHKQHASTPEHVGFDITCREDWETKAKPFLKATRDRIPFEAYRQRKKEAAEKGRFFCCSGANVFELMHPICGHEHMLLGMCLDIDWVKDMVKVYSKMLVELMTTLFDEEGEPDGVWFYEDMGFKHRPFMSPEMYEDIIMPGHIRTIDFCHSRNLPVIMHSCGFIEPLLPGMVKAGIDCLQVIEIKAGMDLLRIHEQFGDKICFCGGMDARNLVANDIEKIRAELNEKIPVVKQGRGYILHSDHSIPDTCNYETYRFFVDEGLKLGKY